MSMKSMLFLFFFTSACIFLLSCQKENVSSGENLQTTANAHSSKNDGATTRTICFTGVAEVNGCIGENIVFGGTVELKENTTMAGNNNVHYIRHWSVKGLTGYGVRPGGSLSVAVCPAPRDYTENLKTGTTYKVVAGSEMFSVRNPNTTTGLPTAVASGDVFIHQGTIVFESSTGERIVVRHVIIKNPGQFTPMQPTFRSAWIVQGKNCAMMNH